LYFFYLSDGGAGERAKIDNVLSTSYFSFTGTGTGTGTDGRGGGGSYEIIRIPVKRFSDVCLMMIQYSCEEEKKKIELKKRKEMKQIECPLFIFFLFFFALMTTTMTTMGIISVFLDR
jgi:hypothetical protein